MTACPIVVIMSDSGQVPKAEDESTDGGAVEDELDSTGMTVGTYRRMHAQIEAEGRQSLSSEALARYDAADAEMSAAVQRVREIASQHAKLPSSRKICASNSRLQARSISRRCTSRLLGWGSHLLNVSGGKRWPRWSRPKSGSQTG